MTMTTTYAGMDAHARTIRVAVLAAEGGRPEEWQLTNEPRSVKRLAQRLKRTAPGPLVACYEAGPGGFALQRQLEAEGIECRVIAPALIPRRPGDRVKTDRRDARKLAELLRADLLTAVHPPTIDQEAVRDLCRAREDAVTDRTRARHRLAKLLLRRGIAYDGRNWTLRHRRWLLTLRFEHPAAQATFDDYLRALEGVEERLRTLEQELAACAASADYREAVGLLRCFRGVDTVTALTVLADRAQARLYRRHRRLADHGKPSVVANVAVARELAGCRGRCCTTARSSTRRREATRSIPQQRRRRRCAAPEQERVDERGQAQEDARYSYAAAAPGAVNPRP